MEPKGGNMSSRKSELTEKQQTALNTLRAAVGNGVPGHSCGERPPNRVCEVCGRKAIPPEKRGGKWVFRLVQKCDNCVMFENKLFDEIKKRKGILPRSLKESEAVFPL